MTTEQLTTANKLNYNIDNLEKRITLLGDINSSCKSIQIRRDELGSVTIEAGNYEPALDCTDCIHYGICYLRRHRANKDDVTPCEDIETIEKEA